LVNEVATTKDINVINQSCLDRSKIWLLLTNDLSSGNKLLDKYRTNLRSFFDLFLLRSPVGLPQKINQSISLLSEALDEQRRRKG